MAEIESLKMQVLDNPEQFAEDMRELEVQFKINKSWIVAVYVIEWTFLQSIDILIILTSIPLGGHW